MSYIEIEDDYYSPENIKIKRDNKDFPQTVSVENSKGVTIFTCTQDWSDLQIHETIKLAFHSFKLGRMRGAGDAFEKIKNYAIEKKQFINFD